MKNGFQLECYPTLYYQSKQNHRFQYINICSTFKFVEIHICFINENNPAVKMCVKDVPLSCWVSYCLFCLRFIRHLFCTEIFIKRFSFFFFPPPFLSFPKPFAFWIKATIFNLSSQTPLSLVRRRLFLCVRIIHRTHGMKAEHKINSAHRRKKKKCCLKRMALEHSPSSGRNKQN